MQQLFLLCIIRLLFTEPNISLPPRQVGGLSPLPAKCVKMFVLTSFHNTGTMLVINQTINVYAVVLMYVTSLRLINFRVSWFR